ncbi:MAG: peptidylprolyl isomerase [Methylococcales bacterium]|nr:peptidylprolyl isomerase [Methylococcales bacterium]
MQITDKLAVSIHYTLTNGAGEQLDSSRGEEPMVYLHGFGQIIPGLENALTGKVVGDKFNVIIAPADAYGERRDDMLQVVPLSMFNDMEVEGKVEVGMQFHADASHGVSVVTVSKIDGDEVTIDGNHPLAGEALTFDVEVMDIRPATEDELTHKHIHGEGCNH